MSLAYKLWKIGSVLEEEDIKKAIKDSTEIKEGNEPDYVNIDFQFENRILKDVEIRDNSISGKNMFFTKKIGGTRNSYYLFPNLNIQNGTLEKSITQLINTINNIKDCNFVDDKNKEYIQQISLKCDDWKVILKNGQKKSNDGIIEKILNYKKGYYWFWFSIDGKSFCDLMPEIWVNWFKSPAIKDKNVKNIEGYDAFTNKITEIGYRPEIKVFSYDNYHDDLKFRINENLPLSLESAKNIKFGWIYILKNLVFYYKGLEYIIIPNFLSDDSEVCKLVLKRLKQANQNNKDKRQSLTFFVDKEKKLSNDIGKYEKKKNIQEIDIEKLNILRKEKVNILGEIDKIVETDHGQFQQFDKEISDTGDLKDSIIIDYVFISLNKTDSSFEIKGSIEDVIPGHISRVVKLMSDNDVCELVTLKNRDNEKTYIQDFFNRNELYLIWNKATKDKKYKLKNLIIKERLYLAKLLLSDETIKLDDLLSRFEQNREYFYDNKKRIKNGIKEWIEFPDKFIRDENNIRKFLMELGKIKE